MTLRRFAWIAIAACVTPAGCTLDPDGEASRRAAAAGDQWAVRLWEDNRPGHIRRIGEIKDELARRTGWDDLWIVHEDHGSTLYWDTFPAPDTREAQQRLQEARAWRTEQGRRSFAKAVLWKVSRGDVGPPQWQLSRAPGEYSVCIAVFHNVPAENFYERKQAAVAYCRQLRESGTEAYYHHGLSRSSVTVGAFPASSVRRVRQGSRHTGVGYVEKVVDPRMKAVLKRYPLMAVNGMIENVTVPAEPGERQPSKRVPVKSYPVHIPRDGKPENRDEAHRRSYR